jgi:hypothetical protein
MAVQASFSAFYGCWAYDERLGSSIMRPFPFLPFTAILKTQNFTMLVALELAQRVYDA